MKIDDIARRPNGLAITKEITRHAVFGRGLPIGIRSPHLGFIYRLYRSAGSKTCMSLSKARNPFFAMDSLLHAFLMCGFENSSPLLQALPENQPLTLSALV
jgi:hypothetical protein